MKEDCIIYGAGKWGKHAYLTMRNERNILFIVDGNEKNWGKDFFDKTISSPDVLKDYSDVPVFIAIDNCHGIREFLQGLGVKVIRNYILPPGDGKSFCIVYGSGFAARDFYSRYKDRLHIVFFVDDNPEQAGCFIDGCPVYGLDMLNYFSDLLLVFTENNSVNAVNNFKDNFMFYTDGVLRPPFPEMKRDQPAVFIDVTMRRRTAFKDGTARVANNILFKLRSLGENVVPVWDMNGTLVTDYGHFQDDAVQEEVVRFIEGDILYLVDPTWHASDCFKGYINDIRLAGGRAYAIIHDFLPQYFPDCFTPSISVPFFPWHDMVLENADGIICDSCHTADVAVDYFRVRNLCRKSELPLFTVHLGADFSDRELSDVHVRPELRRFLEQDNVFLMVGTVEARKGHKDAVDALKVLLRNNFNCRLLIIGKDGWLNSDFKVKAEPYLGTEIMWLKDASDDELQWAYRHSTALIFASLDEGFGLPIVEAALNGLPILCSDIAVFHELAGEHAYYFPAGDGKGLAEAVVSWSSLSVKPDSSRIRVLSWEDSIRNLLDVFRGESKPYLEI